MNLDQLAKWLIDDGWKDVRPGNYVGIDFDLVGNRGYFDDKWKLLVKKLLRLDRKIARGWHTKFDNAGNETKNRFAGRFFIVCLLVDEVNSKALKPVQADLTKLARAVAGKGGNGHVFIVDTSKGEFHGAIPELPYVINKNLKRIKKLLMATLDSTGETLRKSHSEGTAGI